MNREQAAFLLKNSVEERRAAKAAILEGERTLAGLTDVIKGILTMYPDMETGEEFEWGDQEETPRGADAVRAVLLGNPSQWFTITDVLDELHNRHWLPDSANPANAVRAALERAFAQPDWGIEKGRTQDNRVAYRAPYDEEPF